MSNVWFCSDLHLGHKNIGKFRTPLINSCEENTERIFNDLGENLTKNDDLWVLGDWCFHMSLVERFRDLKCRHKYLVRGNHDRFDMGVYNKVFNAVFGIVRYKGFWLSHAPIHPDELRGKVNLHGHVHYSSINDSRYFNCCPENLWPKYGRCLVSLDELRNHFIL